jgi:casein kinase II subunit beta
MHQVFFEKFCITNTMLQVNARITTNLGFDLLFPKQPRKLLRKHLAHTIFLLIMNIWILILAALTFSKSPTSITGYAEASSGFMPNVAREDGLDTNIKKHSSIESQKVSRFSKVKDILNSWENEEEERLLRVLEEIDQDSVLLKDEKVSKRRRKRTVKRKKRSQVKQKNDNKELKKIVKNAGAGSQMLSQESKDFAKNPMLHLNVGVTNEDDLQLIDSNQDSMEIKAEEVRSSSSEKENSDRSNNGGFPKPTLLYVPRFDNYETESFKIAKLQSKESCNPIPRHVLKSSLTQSAYTVPSASSANAKTISGNVLDGFSNVHPDPVGMSGATQQSTYQLHSPAQVRNSPRKLALMDQRVAMLSFTTPWVIQFLQSRAKDAMVAVPRDFLGDGFNLVHLAPLVESMGGSHDMTFPLYKAALRVILSLENILDVSPQVQRAAEYLYVLLHSRYVTSPRGLDAVRQMIKYDPDVFGKCPRPACRGTSLLPLGEMDPGRNSRRYCCCCRQEWECWDSKVDGIAWGSSFCHLFLLTYGSGDLWKGGDCGSNVKSFSTGNPPSIFGFRIHPAALSRIHSE